MSSSATQVQGAVIAGAKEKVPAGRLARSLEELEAYRGLAALGILLFHAYQHSRVGDTYVYENIPPLHFVLRNLDAGVDWFFALSGFLLFLPFARAAAEQGSRQIARGF